MSIKIAEAIGDENGHSKGGEPGDQTGNEILIRTFKKRSYDFTVIMRCTDRDIAAKAADIAKRIALAPQFGYNQDARWTGANAIEAVGVDNLEKAKAGDFDCSSLCIESYKLAGITELKHTGYTGSIPKILMKTGKFEQITPSLDADYMEECRIGDIADAPNKHALIVLTNGSKAEQDPEPEPTTDYVKIIKGKVNVRKTPRIPVKKNSNVYYVAKKGEKFTYTGKTVEDDTGKAWWGVICDGRTGYISSENEKHAVLVGI